MNTTHSIYSRNGDGYSTSREFRSTFFRLETRIEIQKWSPQMHERITTWSIVLGHWSLCIQRRTKHFADNDWKSEPPHQPPPRPPKPLTTFLWKDYP